MTQKTVAMIALHTIVGGMERIVLDICRNLPRYRATFFYANQGPFVAEFKKAGIPTAPLYLSPEKHSNIQESGLDSKALGLIDGHSIVHYHCMRLSEFEIATLRTLKRPVIIGLHWPTALPKIPWPILIPSESILRVQHPENRCLYVPNGTDLVRFKPPSAKPAKKTLRIVRVCRPEKCADYFWDAVRTIMERNPHVSVDIVGEEGKSSERITYHGVTHEVPGILSQADIFFYAPFPDVGAHDVAILEAMAMELPCVLSDVPCVRTSKVEHGRSGFLFPANETETAVGYLQKLIDDPALRQSMGARARQIVAAEFSIQTMAKRLEDIYDNRLSDAPLPH